MEKIKILIVNGGIMDRGDISAFILNYLKHFDFNAFSIDILVHGNEPTERDCEVDAIYKDCQKRVAITVNGKKDWKRFLK